MHWKEWTKRIQINAVTCLTLSTGLLSFLPLLPIQKPIIRVLSGLSEECLPALEKAARHSHETAIELEIPLLEKTLRLLTTTDGTLRPLMPFRTHFPEWLKVLSRYRLGQDSDPSMLKWDSLTAKEKLKVLQLAAEGKRDSFFQNRQITGLKVRNSVHLTFEDPTTFMGKVYAPGSHEIALKDIFTDKVEYRSQEDVQNVSGIELHMRAPVSSGSLSTDARTFLAGAGLPKLHQHVHIVGRVNDNVPMSTTLRELWALERTDYFLRINLSLEMQARSPPHSITTSQFRHYMRMLHAVFSINWA